MQVDVKGIFMMNIKKLGLAIVVVSTIQTSHTMDIRKAWLDFPHNKQEECGNTFWHQLVKKAEGFEDWSEVNKEIELFMINHQRWMPNPMIRNDQNNTARKEAKISFEKNGNAVVGLLVVYLRNSESEFLNKVALQENRKLMNYAQYLDCDKAKNLNLEMARMLVEQLHNKKNV